MVSLRCYEGGKEVLRRRPTESVCAAGLDSQYFNERPLPLKLTSTTSTSTSRPQKIRPSTALFFVLGMTSPAQNRYYDINLYQNHEIFLDIIM